MSISNSFVEKRDAFHSAPCKATFLRDFGADFGVGNITYLGTRVRAQHPLPNRLMTTYSEKWSAHYFDQGFDLIDPVLIHATKRSLPLDWREVPRGCAKVKQFFGQAEDFGVSRLGVTLPVRCQNGDEALISLGSDDQRGEWESILTHQVPELIYFSHLLHEEILNIAPCEGDDCPKDLSTREREVLRWAADGKTSWETSQILNLSERTVNFYIANACKKLDVANKTQAVAVAIRNNSLGFVWNG